MTTDGTNGVLQIISNPVRKSTIQFLKGNSMIFSEVMRACGLNPNYDSGPFYYHLSVLLDSNIVEKKGNRYRLTQFGNTIANFIDTLQREGAFLLKATEPNKGGEILEKNESRRLGQAVIKYLIANGHNWDKCIELAISEGLSISRDILRGILDDLIDLRVLQIRDADNIKPFVLYIIGAAFDYLDLTFTKEEIQGLLSVKEGKLEGEWACYANVVYEVDGKEINRYRGIAADTCLEVLVGRFIDYTYDIDGEDESMHTKVKNAFGEQTLKDLMLLAPERTTFEKIKRAQPHPFEFGKIDLYDIYEATSVEDVRRAVIQVFERDLNYAIERLKKFASFLEERGYEGLHAFLKGKMPHHSTSTGGGRPLPDWRFHDEFLWATTMALRDGCKLGEKLGADQKALKEVRQLADALDFALVKKYGGTKAEGSNLIEWDQTTS